MGCLYHKMNKKPLYLYFIIILIALSFRLPGLSFRTMHGDEAVNAIKYSALLENGEYQYNPAEYHGPVLYYSTLPFSLLLSQTTLQELSESALRIVPVIFCIGLLLILLIIKDRVGWTIVLLSSLLIAVSPIFVYYSRYYIHEMLFVFFGYATIFSAIKLYDKADASWAGLCAAFLALTIATKETWIILLGAMALALVLLIIFYPELRNKIFKRLREFSIGVYSSFLLSFLIVYILMFTSFFQNFSGLWDSLAAISTYLDKSDSTSVHVHPWYQYFKWLMFSSSDSHFWSEGVIGILGIVGISLVFFKKDDTSYKLLFFIRLVALVTIISTLIFSALLYKTPWNALSFWMGWILLAAYGFSAILKMVREGMYKYLFLGVVALGILHLSWQSYQINYIEYENHTNPYVYAHPQKDIFRILDSLDKIVENHPDKKDMYIQVIIKDNDYWPLPWYLRRYTQVGWWDKVDMDIPSAGFIISGPHMEADLVRKFYEITEPGKRDLYVPLLPDYITLRPEVRLKVYVTLNVRDLLTENSDEL